MPERSSFHKFSQLKIAVYGHLTVCRVTQASDDVPRLSTAFCLLALFRGVPHSSPLSHHLSPNLLPCSQHHTSSSPSDHRLSSLFIFEEKESPNLADRASRCRDQAEFLATPRFPLSYKLPLTTFYCHSRTSGLVTAIGVTRETALVRRMELFTYQVYTSTCLVLSI